MPHVYRVLLTGIHLMRTGRIEANLGVLDREYGLPQVRDLIDEKRCQSEHAPLGGEHVAFHEREIDRLRARLQQAHAESDLPERPAAHDGLHDLLVRIRLRGLAAAGH